MKAEERIIKFPDNAPEAVEIMVCWLYEGQISLSEQLWEHGRSEKTGSTTCDILADLHVIAKKYQIRNLRKDAAWAMGEFLFRSDFNVSIIPLVWELTSDRESPLRKLMLCFVSYTMERGLLDWLEDESSK